MRLLSLKLLLGLLLFLSYPYPLFAQDEYYFNDEFNIERPGGQLDTNKWVVYPNSVNCGIDTVKELAGFVLLKQCSLRTQFPYIVSKNDPFPNSDFTAEVKFEYIKAAAWGNGIEFVDKAPANGSGFTQLFGLGFWEDTSTGLNMRFQFKGSVVHSIAVNRNSHIFKLEKTGLIYKMYLDGQLVFTSPLTSDEIHAIYLGNPSIQPLPFAEWSWFRVDYIRVIQTGPIEVAPEPFLDLPWDYQAKGMSFNEAATSINSYFDHEYPFLSTTLIEPPNLINYLGIKDDSFYTSHDGYDYGNAAKTKLSTPLLAPANGEATFMSPKTCLDCGNAILIDHKNGYQTRYYHLRDEGLLVSQEGQKINVVKGQKIGEVGFTGNVKPDNIAGSHLHFMVIQDKNKDGNFNDNIPDGITDPFGWQSTAPDPWENYSFFYKGAQRTGNKSYYLFTKKLDNLNETLSSNAKVFEIGKTKLDFPEGAINQNLNLSAKTEPNFFNDVLNSLGSVINIQTKDSSGNPVTSFLKNFSLAINFSQFDLTRYNLDTLSIYSSPDGQNWTKENTQIDLNNKTASASLNHLTYFALMAERKDKIAPTTAPILNGEQGTDNNFRSDVILNLNSQDNPDGLGVEFTAYSFDQTDWKQNTNPLVFTDEGIHKVYFYSQDNDGNVEEVKSVEFAIDKTIPEAKVYIDLDKLDLTVQGVDNNPTTFSSTPNPVTLKPNDAIYRISDPAGNSLTLDVRDRDKTNKDSFRIYSLQYNNEAPIVVNQNLFNVSYTERKEKRYVTEQRFDYKGETKIRIQYDLKNDLTTIITKENGSEKVKEILPGIVLLKLQTDKGNLLYLY